MRISMKCFNLILVHCFFIYLDQYLISSVTLGGISVSWPMKRKAQKYCFSCSNKLQRKTVRWYKHYLLLSLNGFIGCSHGQYQLILILAIIDTSNFFSSLTIESKRPTPHNDIVENNNICKLIAIQWKYETNG